MWEWDTERVWPFNLPLPSSVLCTCVCTCTPSPPPAYLHSLPVRLNGQSWRLMLCCPGQWATLSTVCSSFLPCSLRGLAAANAKPNCNLQPPERKKGAGMWGSLYRSVQQAFRPGWKGAGVVAQAAFIVQYQTGFSSTVWRTAWFHHKRLCPTETGNVHFAHKLYLGVSMRSTFLWSGLFVQ